MRVNGADIYHELRGSGPSVLLIPGGGGDSGTLARLADDLVRDFMVVAYDRRGLSRSPRPKDWKGTSIAEQAEDAAALLRALGVAPSAVVGASLGALIALELLLKHPDLVRRASLLDPGPLDSAIPDRRQRMVLPEPVRAAMAGGDPEAGFEALMRDLELWDALDHATRQRMLGNADLFFTYESGLLQSYRPDDALLTANRVPVQVGAGEAAPPLFREMAGWLASRLMVRVETYPGGHAAASTHPDEVSRVIRPFLQSKRVDKVGGAPMSDPRALFERLLAAINAHDLQAASGFISPDCEIVTPFATLRGPEPFKTYVQGLIDAFPDFKQTVHNTVCEGSTLVTEWTLTGTHLGPMRMPNGSLLPPTGKKMNAHGCDVYKWEGGQVMADRIYRDRLETLIQLGLSPDPAAARA